MKIFKTIGKACTIVALFVAMPAYAQDLMVDALPIDRKLRALDSISISRLHAREVVADAELAELYPSWTNRFEYYRNAVTPQEYRIDLRGFHMPCDSRLVTSHYGYRRRFRRNHYGTDLKVYHGDTIRAAFSGKVRIVLYDRDGFGKYVVIRHPNGLETYYAHMSKQLVVPNQMVKAGEAIGLAGNTGRSFGVHLHFETRFLGHKIDPEKLFSFENRDVRGDTYVFRANGRSSISNERVLASAQTNATALENQNEKTKEAQSVQEKKSSSKNSRGQIHKVRKGDSLYKIAKKYNTTVDKICRLNNIPKNRKLSLGQIIRYS